MCPANSTVGALFGSGYYTDNSDICTAGAQAGQMNLQSGGELMYTISPGMNAYGATVANGITSQSWGAWPGSFQITGPKG